MLKIQFSGLSLGNHHFNFHVDDALFQSQNYDEISDCEVSVDVDLEKTERFLKLDFEFSGTYSVPCDRCLDPVEIPIQHSETLIVNFGNQTNFDNEVWEISTKEHELIFDNFIYETLVLIRPFSVMHDLADCNPEMLKRLQQEPQSAVNSEMDARWEALKKVKCEM